MPADNIGFRNAVLRQNSLFGFKPIPTTGLKALSVYLSDFGEKSRLVDAHGSGYAQAVFFDLVQDGGVGQA